MNKIQNKTKKSFLSKTIIVLLLSLFLIPTFTPKPANAFEIPNWVRWVVGGTPIGTVVAPAIDGINYYNKKSTGKELVCVKGVFDSGWINLDVCIGMGLYYLMLKPAGYILWFAGVLFNMALNFTLNFGAVINDPSIGLGSSSANGGIIYLGWSTIRNFINVSFIFVLLYISIATILQLDGYNTKKMIIKIVLAALLLNFSLFFTKAIIDLSNLLALQFYSRILDASARASGLTLAESSSAADGGLSGGFLNALGLKTIWGGGSSSQLSDVGAFTTRTGLVDGYQLIIISLLGSVFMLVFAFVLVLATIQFFIRSLILIVLMLTSAVGFLGGSVPGLESTSKDWWSKLKENAIFAPAYMAMLYMVSQIVFGANKSGLMGQDGFIGVIRGDAKYAPLIFWFALVIGLLLSVQMVAGRFASKFGSGVTKKASDLMKNGGKWVGKKYWGATGGAAIKGVGIAGRKLSTSTFGGALLTKTPLSRIGGQRVFDNLAAKEVEVAKEKAKNLRRLSGESDTAYEGRQNAIRSRAMAKQATGFGLDTSHFDYDNGKMTLNAEGKKAIKARKIAAQTRFSKFARKNGDDAAERISSAYADPKKGSEDDVKIVIKTLEKNLEKEKDHVYEVLAKQYDTEVETINNRIKADLAAGRTASAADITGLKAAKKILAEHTEPVRKLEKSLAEAKEKLEKVKSAEKEKANKDSKGGKK